MSTLVLRFYIFATLTIFGVGRSAFAGPGANFSAILSPGSQAIQVNCTVPVGMGDECTRALTIDCQRVTQCNGDRECITNRPRVDVSACEDEAPSKAERPEFDEEADVRQKITRKLPPAKSVPAQPPSHAQENAPEEKLPTHDQSSSVVSENRDNLQIDPSGDVQICIRALSSAQSACNVNQANSFSSQLSGASDGIYGTGSANAGLQNVNNVVVNCSNSQSICASTCESSLSSLQTQCGGGCSASVQNAIGKLGDASSACGSLTSNVRYLSNAANESVKFERNKLSTNDVYKTSSSRTQSAAGAAGGYSGSPASSDNGGQIVDEAGNAEFSKPSSLATASDFNVPSHGSFDASAQQAMQQVEVGGRAALAKPTPNGAGGGNNTGTWTAGTVARAKGSPAGGKGSSVNADGKASADIESGYLSGGGYQPNVGTDGSGFDVIRTPTKPIPRKVASWEGFSLRDAFNRWFSRHEEAPEIHEKQREKVSESYLTILGNEFEIYMESMPPPVRRLPVPLFACAVLGFLLLVRWAILSGISRIQKIVIEENGRRQAPRRSGVDRRSPNQIPIEPFLERRSHTNERRARDQRVADDRRSSGPDPNGTVIIQAERRQSSKNSKLQSDPIDPLEVSRRRRPV